MPQAPHIELHPVSQLVQVHVDGMLLVDSTQSLELCEIGYPPSHYFPREDARMDLLTITEIPSIASLKCIQFVFL
ncbi:DUF427 domain-containing protein [Vreelandella titanicae]|uniref:DUF427 domain-containing protein n=1 Tax=Vreelandella titanicae TaxID=664683 RepID=UPI0039BF344C